MTLADIMLNNIQAVCDLQDSEEDHEDPNTPKSLVSIKDMAHTFELIHGILCDCHGEMDTLLAYAI